VPVAGTDAAVQSPAFRRALILHAANSIGRHVELLRASASCTNRIVAELAESQPLIRRLALGDRTSSDAILAELSAVVDQFRQELSLSLGCDRFALARLAALRSKQETAGMAAGGTEPQRSGMDRSTTARATAGDRGRRR